MSDRVHVGNLNLRNLADRWWERLALLAADFGTLQPDIFGLQECVYVMHQDRVLGATGEGRYGSVRGWAGRPEYGNAILVKEPLVARDEERLEMGMQRASVRCLIDLPGGARLLVVVTHLHHAPDEPEPRLDEVNQILRWLEGAPAHDAMIVMGDFNAHPPEATYGRMLAAGFRSAYREANGSEPEKTWRTPIVAPMIDDTGSEGCIDYIFFRGAIEVERAWLTFDRPDPEDPGLWPSDHYGLSAWLRVG
jgi:endonuclease/exonuclease/phosphatase family metal-dependent hydrolase